MSAVICRHKHPLSSGAIRGLLAHLRRHGLLGHKRICFFCSRSHVCAAVVSPHRNDDLPWRIAVLYG